MKSKNISRIDYRISVETNINRKLKIEVFNQMSIDVFMKDGRILKDLKVLWIRSGPEIRIRNKISLNNNDLNVYNISNDEAFEIEDAIKGKEGIYKSLVEISKKIEGIEKSSSILFDE